MAINTFSISDLGVETLDKNKDSVEVSRDNGDGTFSSYKVNSSDFAFGVSVGQSLLQASAMPLQPGFLRLDGGAYDKSSYSEISQYFPSERLFSEGADLSTYPYQYFGSGKGNIVHQLNYDGSKAYVAIDGENLVRVFDTSTGNEIKSFDPFDGESPTDFLPQSSELSPDGSMIAMSISTGTSVDSKSVSSEIFVINTETDSIEYHVAGGTSGWRGRYEKSVSFNKDGSRLACRYGTEPHGIKIINTSDNTLFSSKNDFTGNVHAFSFDFSRPSNSEEFIMVNYDDGGGAAYKIWRLRSSDFASAFPNTGYNSTYAGHILTFYDEDKMEGGVILFQNAANGDVEKFDADFSQAAITENVEYITGAVEIKEGGESYFAIAIDDGFDSSFDVYIRIYRSFDLSRVSQSLIEEGTGDISANNMSISGDKKRISISVDDEAANYLFEYIGAETSNFILPDVSSPDDNLEYRIKASS